LCIHTHSKGKKIAAWAAGPHAKREKGKMGDNLHSEGLVPGGVGVVLDLSSLLVLLVINPQFDKSVVVGC
jgi:hypothetical protein